MTEPTPQAEPFPRPEAASTEDIMKKAGRLKNKYDLKAGEGEWHREELAKREASLREARDSYEQKRTAMNDLYDVRADMEREFASSLSETPPTTAAEAEQLATILKEHERRLATFDSAITLIRELMSEVPTGYAEDSPAARRDAAAQSVYQAVEGERSALLDSVQHFHANEEVYKQAAVKEAQAAGVEVNYPPYTEPKPQAEAAPAVAEGDGGGSE